VWRSLADAELARRFRRERQILASLNHPNIARLLDGGVSAEGEPFFAMEHVEGVRIDDYCIARNLSVNQRLRLFLHVCQGVAYAHQHLVVHRDLKPSNILVTEEGTPKLLDFGIAKLLDAEHAGEHTQTNLRAFTPDYASPEQIAGGQITTASDVFSLGILLHELLHGAHASSRERMQPGGWLSANNEKKTLLINARTNETDKSSNLKSQNSDSINHELKNIIAMARREEPARRYPSVGQFAEDIQSIWTACPFAHSRILSPTAPKSLYAVTVSPSLRPRSSRFRSSSVSPSRCGKQTSPASNATARDAASRTCANSRTRCFSTSRRRSNVCKARLPRAKRWLINP
jgi:serine/threonine-protein kinase